MQKVRIARNLGLAFSMILGAAVTADEKTPVAVTTSEEAKANETTDKAPKAVERVPSIKDVVRISADDNIWVNKKKRTVIVGGTICLRQGQLEMFACPEGTKEHESIVALKSRAKFIHAGLLSVGAKPGRPVQYDPKFQAAHGDIIDVFVVWNDGHGNEKKVRAQDMVRRVKTGKPMNHNWVFAGSGFWKSPEDGQRHYLAEGGEAICVSNFSSAMLDLDVESSQEASGLLFDAMTDNIPELGTWVEVHLIPRAKDEKKPKAS